MYFTFHPKYSFFVLPSNILGIKWIEKTLDLFAPLQATLRVQCFILILTGNGRSGSCDRKNLIGCYWKYNDNGSFYQISCVTIIVIVFRRICWILSNVIQFQYSRKPGYQKNKNNKNKYKNKPADFKQ